MRSLIRTSVESGHVRFLHAGPPRSNCYRCGGRIAQRVAMRR
jgi:hypothetical protein